MPDSPTPAALVEEVEGGFMVSRSHAQQPAMDEGPRSPSPPREMAVLAAGAGTLIAAAAAQMMRSPFVSDFDMPVPYRRAPQPRIRPRISYQESRRLRRASEMIASLNKPVPLKHMHSAARRRALSDDGTEQRGSVSNAEPDVVPGSAK